MVLKVLTCTFWSRSWALSSEMTTEIHEPLWYVKNCAKCIVYIISPFLTTWKRDIFISSVYMRKMILIKLKLDFNSSLAYFHTISMTLCCLLQCHTVFCVLILILPNSWNQPPASVSDQGNQDRPVRIVYCVSAVPTALGHVIRYNSMLLLSIYGFLSIAKPWIPLEQR